MDQLIAIYLWFLNDPLDSGIKNISWLPNTGSICLPLSVLKNLETVSFAVPFSFKKLCSLSSVNKIPSRLHSALQSVLKLSFVGGGPHVNVKRWPKNTWNGSEFKGVEATINRNKRKSFSCTKWQKIYPMQNFKKCIKFVLQSNIMGYSVASWVDIPVSATRISESCKAVPLTEYSTTVLPLL